MLTSPAGHSQELPPAWGALDSLFIPAANLSPDNLQAARPDIANFRGGIYANIASPAQRRGHLSTVLEYAISNHLPQTGHVAAGEAMLALFDEGELSAFPACEDDALAKGVTIGGFAVVKSSTSAELIPGIIFPKMFETIVGDRFEGYTGQEREILARIAITGMIKHAIPKEEIEGAVKARSPINTDEVKVTNDHAVVGRTEESDVDARGA
jgi:hypothetical protein